MSNPKVELESKGECTPILSAPAAHLTTIQGHSSPINLKRVIIRSFVSWLDVLLERSKLVRTHLLTLTPMWRLALFTQKFLGRPTYFMAYWRNLFLILQQLQISSNALKFTFQHSIYCFSKKGVFKTFQCYRILRFSVSCFEFWGIFQDCIEKTN